MLDVDRLREWARLLLVHGPDISHWGSVPFVASKMQTLATDLEKAIRDIGRLRAGSAPAAVRAPLPNLVDRLNDFLFRYCTGFDDDDMELFRAIATILAVRAPLEGQETK